MSRALLGMPGAWLLAGVFAVCGVLDVIAARHLHDEGLLTYYFARMTADDPVATFFLQKSRPPISALYAGFAAVGPPLFGIAHVLFAALAIPALSASARALGHRFVALPGLVLAASPLFFASAAAGVSNSDAVAVACFAGWLWLAPERRFAAGVLLGMLPWIRAELAPLSFALLVVAWRERSWMPWLGALVFPLGYATLGALVHGDVLWMAHYPPALPEPMPGNPFWSLHDGRIGTAELLASLLALSPVFVLALVVPLQRLRPVERAWLLFAAFELGVLLSLPRWRAFNFDLSPRYLLGVVPALALAASRTIEGWWHDTGRRAHIWEVVVLVVAAALAWRAAAAGAHATALIAVAIVAAAIACARASRPNWAAAIALALVMLGPLGFDEGARLRRDRVSPELDEVVTRLAEHPQWRERPIYTNAPLLAAHLRRIDPERPGAVNYLVQADQLHELVALSNPQWSQRTRMLAAIGDEFYGIPVLPDALVPARLPADALFVLVDDPRLELVLPAERWDPRLELLSTSLRVRIAQLVPGGGGG